MQSLLVTLYKGILKTIEEPQQIIDILNKGKLFKHFLKHFNILRLKLRIGDSWSTYYGRQDFKRRVYPSYEDYLIHQKTKLQHLDLSDYDVRYREALRERLEKLTLIKQGMSVLCLAARIGTEVKSFLDIGCFAIGIDLNPGENNQYVVYGDFHNIQFASNSIDIVFTNSLDHIFNMEKAIGEIARVLKSDGLLIVEAVRGINEGQSPDFFASFWWSQIDDVVSCFENSQIRLVKRSSFDYPWYGEQLCFEKEK
jgi:SAM-dependent methyltransferase